MAKMMLHPGARWIFRIRGFFGALIFAWIFGWIIFLPLGFLIFGNAKAIISNPVTFFSLGIGFILIYIIIVIAIAEIYARMSYTRWFYEFTKDNLKLERGIIWKRYSNIPYERVQNVDITRGIIARLYGFSSVNIQTAGYSYTGRGMPHSEGYIPAVNMNEAEKIRNFLMKKIGKRSKQGL